MAAIASTRIASSGVFHKPQTHDTSAAGGADASSPFDQLLNATANAPDAAGGSNDQPAQDQPDTGKNPSQDTNPGNKTGQAQQTATNQIVAAAANQVLIQAGATNDNPDPTSSDATGNPSNNATTQQDSNTQQGVADPSQVLAAAQFPLPAQNNGTPANVPDGKDSAPPGTDPGVPTLASTPSAQDTASQNMAGQSVTTTQIAAAQSAASSQNASSAAGATADSTSDTAAAASSASASGSSGSSADPSKTDGKTKLGGKDRIAQIQAANALTQADPSSQAAPQIDPSAPVAKKDSKPAKTQDQGTAATTNNQAAPVDPATALVAVASALPSAAANPAPTTPGDAVSASDAAGAAKGGTKNSQASSDPPAGAEGADKGNPASGDGPKANAAQALASSPAGTQAQDPFTAQGSNGTGNQPAIATSDRSDSHAAAAPGQPQAQSAPPQAQPAPSQPAMLPPIQPQQAHGVATPSVTQNIQVSQPDAGSAANTVSALAVAIAAKSQSGNKQFDIRLDPPELGRVEVRLSIDASGKAQASLSADQPRTLDMLKTDAPVLARALRDAGLNVAQNGLNFSLRGQDRQNGGNALTPRPGRASPLSLIATSAIGSVPGGANYQGPADGRLDIRV